MRTSALLRSFFLLSIASSAAASIVEGQWTISAAVAADRFWGGSVEIAPDHRSFKPYRPTTIALGLERRTRGIGLGLNVGYTGASLGLEGTDAVVAVKGVFEVYSIAPEVSFRIVSLGTGNTLLLHAGPLIEVWSLVDEDTRSRAGCQGAVSLEVPLSKQFGLALSAGAALTSSPFENGELDGYELRALWRRRFGLGLNYRI
jgi:hypothetical protein